MESLFVSVSVAAPPESLITYPTHVGFLFKVNRLLVNISVTTATEGFITVATIVGLAFVVDCVLVSQEGSSRYHL